MDIERHRCISIKSILDFGMVNRSIGNYFYLTRIPVK
jgi:hypothetical protein